MYILVVFGRQREESFIYYDDVCEQKQLES